MLKVALKGHTPMTRPRSVLIIEDDPVFVQLYQTALTRYRHSFDIVASENGYDAMAQLIRTDAKLVILDMMMPKFDGATFLSIVKSKPEYQALPIVVISSEVSKQRIRFAHLPSVHWFKKPIAINTLLAVLLTELGTQIDNDQLDDDPSASDDTRPDDFSNELDPLHLARYLGRDRVIQASFVHRFCSMTVERCVALRAASKDDNYQQLRDLAHTLNGSTATLGAHAANKSCVELINSIDQGNTAQSHILVNTLIDQLCALTVALSRHYRLENF